MLLIAGQEHASELMLLIAALASGDNNDLISEDKRMPVIKVMERLLRLRLWLGQGVLDATPLLDGTLLARVEECLVAYKEAFEGLSKTDFRNPKSHGLKHYLKGLLRFGATVSSAGYQWEGALSGLVKEASRQGSGRRGDAQAANILERAVLARSVGLALSHLEDPNGRDKCMFDKQYLPVPANPPYPSYYKRIVSLAPPPMPCPRRRSQATSLLSAGLFNSSSGEDAAQVWTSPAAKIDGHGGAQGPHMANLPQERVRNNLKTGWSGGGIKEQTSFSLLITPPPHTYTTQHILEAIADAATRDLRFHKLLKIGSGTSNRSDSIFHCDPDFRDLPWHDYCVFTPDPATQVQSLGRIHAIFDGGISRQDGGGSHEFFNFHRRFEIDMVIVKDIFFSVKFKHNKMGRTNKRPRNFMSRGN